MTSCLFNSIISQTSACCPHFYAIKYKPGFIAEHAWRVYNCDFKPTPYNDTSPRFNISRETLLIFRCGELYHIIEIFF